MSFKCGIVGLPNVGKSTLFNALTDSSKAQAANFPFCTIDPNVGVVPVPDERLNNLAKVSNSKKIINTTISFVDIAGLVKGASKGEGLGNKFLSHIREVDAIIHMIRCFDSDDIQNVNPNVDPIRDLEIIETEMMLADLESIQKRLEKSNKKNVDEELLKILEIAQDCINNNKDLSILKEQFDKKTLNQSGLLSIKPKIFVCNVDEQSVQNGNQYTKSFIDKFGEENTLIVSADIENQINALEKEERKNYMEMIGLTKLD
jgi:GTP-binding protein YchF